jgi:hypothetical protein
MSVPADSPGSATSINKRTDIKKDVGENPPPPIFEVRPSHCPLEKISNVKPAHVERYIYHSPPLGSCLVNKQHASTKGYTLFI